MPFWKRTWIAASLALLFVGSGFLPSPQTAAAEPPPVSPEADELAERAKLFVALLRRRAERILEARRAPPPPLFSAFSGLQQGYESNVNLDGSRRGDSFSEESASFLFSPRLTPWLEGEVSYDLLADQYHDFTDSNLVSQTLRAVLQVRPHRQVEGELGYEFGTLRYPRAEDNSFLDHRWKTSLAWAQTSWLTHKVGWTYQYREYDTRLARDSDQNRLAGLAREDRRHVGSYEMRLRFPKLSARLGAEFYRNFSNDHFQDFYDWEDLRFRLLLTCPLTLRWVGAFTASAERKNYQSRTVPAIDVAQRDNLLTAAGSLIYQFHPHASLNYSVIYRHQDSNDPRLDFMDWVHQVGVSVSF